MKKAIHMTCDQIERKVEIVKCHYSEDKLLFANIM